VLFLIQKVLIDEQTSKNKHTVFITDSLEGESILFLFFGRLFWKVKKKELIPLSLPLPPNLCPLYRKSIN